MTARRAQTFAAWRKTMPDAYGLLVFAHVALFVYWLGPDWAVYLLSPTIWRADRAIDERLASMQLLIRMTQISRNALILLLPVGLTLAAMSGAAPPPAAWLWGVWGFSIAWLGASLFMHHARTHPMSPILNRIDAAIRWVLMIGLVAAGVHALFAAGFFQTPWVALKAILYGLLLGNSLQQRAIARRWMGAILAIKADPTTAAAQQKMFQETGRRSQLNAYFTWAASLAIAFLGVTKLSF